jgi:hypothetical protein
MSVTLMRQISSAGPKLHACTAVHSSLLVILTLLPLEAQGRRNTAVDITSRSWGLVCDLREKCVNYYWALSVIFRNIMVGCLVVVRILYWRQCCRVWHRDLIIGGELNTLPWRFKNHRTVVQGICNLPSPCTLRYIILLSDHCYVQRCGKTWWSPVTDVWWPNKHLYN